MPRPPCEPFTEDELKKIETLAGYGLDEKGIAAVMDCGSVATFQRRLAKSPNGSAVIERGRNRALSAVTQTAYQMAMSKKFPALTIFWLKCRGRWREVNHVEHSGPDGAPIEQKIECVVRDYRKK